MKDKVIIGRAEKADFPQLEATRVPVKIDTGADASTIWAKAIELESDRLHVIFFGPDSKHFTAKEHIFSKGQYSITRVANSFGQREVRYKVKLGIRVKKRLIRGSFTLSDRSQKLYPVLIGRSLLKNKFLVDVSKGNPLRNEEKLRADQLRKELDELRGES